MAIEPRVFETTFLFALFNSVCQHHYNRPAPRQRRHHFGANPRVGQVRVPQNFKYYPYIICIYYCDVAYTAYAVVCVCDHRIPFHSSHALLMCRSHTSSNASTKYLNPSQISNQDTDLGDLRDGDCHEMLQHLAPCSCISNRLVELFTHTNDCILTPENPLEMWIRISKKPAKIDIAKSNTCTTDTPTVTIITPSVC
jgi:hypothetical protein